MSKKILLFEDDPVVIGLFKSEFENKGFKAVFYPDYSDPVETVAREKPDLILCNIIVKGEINGFEGVELLKSDYRTKDIPVMFFTNISHGEDIEKGKSLGAIDHIVKSHYSSQEIIEKIELFFLNGRNNH